MPVPVAPSPSPPEWPPDSASELWPPSASRASAATLEHELGTSDRALASVASASASGVSPDTVGESLDHMNQLPAVSRENTKAMPRKKMPISAPFLGMRLPKNRISRNDRAMRAGTIQTCVKNHMVPTQPFSSSSSSMSMERLLR